MQVSVSLKGRIVRHITIGVIGAIGGRIPGIHLRAFASICGLPLGIHPQLLLCAFIPEASMDITRTAS